MELASIRLAIPQYHFCVTTNNVIVRSTTRRLRNKTNCKKSGSGSTSQLSNGSSAIIVRPMITRNFEKESQFLMYPIKNALAKFKKNKPLARNDSPLLGTTQYSW